MRQKLFFYLLFSCIFLANSKNLSQDVALKVARQFYSTEKLNCLEISNNSEKNLKVSSDSISTSGFFVVSKINSPGYILIAGNDENPTIIGFSNKGKVDSSRSLPPQLEYLIENYNKSGNFEKSRKSSGVPAKNYSLGAEKVLKTAPWGQEYPFNYNCPIIEGIQSPTGCVPTAIGILMKYYNWPLQGKNSRLYFDYEDLQTKNFDFSNFNPKWDLLKDNYEGVELSEEELDAIGSLMREIGYGVSTSYGLYESGTIGDGLNIHMRRYFNFGHEIAQSYKENLSEKEWNDKIKAEIDENRPLIYLANDVSSAHCFIIDGYNEEGLLHVNWGWDGYFNGFYDPELLNPLGTIFEPISMITGIGKPGKDDEKWGDAYPIKNQKFII